MNLGDCYYYYYSSCTKGATCPFRHEPAALGSEEVCTLWREGRCQRAVCSFRHMEIMKDRSTIPCFWETQPSGCQKPHCAFLHTKPKSFDNLNFQNQQQRQRVPAAIASQYPSQYPQQGQAHTSGLTSGSVGYARPQIQQMVINPFEEESDQESLGGGTPVKKPPPEISAGPPRTVLSSTNEPPQGKSLNFEIKSLDEIRKEKKRKQESDESSSSQPTEDSLPAKREPVKKIKLSTARSPKKDSSAVVVKSLEEITREKALESLAKRKAQKAAETKRTQIVASTPAQPAEPIDSSRRIIVRKEEPVSAEPVAPKRTLRIKDRLGKIKGSDSEDSTTKPITVKPACRVKERLGIAKADDASQKTAPKVSQIKSRLGLTRAKMESADSGSQSEGESTQTSDVDLNKIQIKSLAQIRAVKTDKDSDVMHIKTLAEIQKEKRKILSQKTILDRANVESTDDDIIETDSGPDETKAKKKMRKENSSKNKVKIIIKDERDEEKHSRRKMKLKRSKDSESPKVVRKVTVNPSSFDDFELKSSKLKRKAKEETSSKVKIQRVVTSDPEVPRKKTNKQPKIQLYEPPAMKNQEPKSISLRREEKLPKTKSDVKSRIEMKPEQEKPRKTLSRKSFDWGVKTFSEIMAEKRMKRQEDLGQNKAPTRRLSEENDESQTDDIPTKRITPITFSDSTIAAVKKPRSKVAPVTSVVEPKFLFGKKNPAAVGSDDLDDLLGETAESVIDPLGSMAGSPVIDKAASENEKAIKNVTPEPEDQLDTTTPINNTEKTLSKPDEAQPSVVESAVKPKTPVTSRRLSQQELSERKKRLSRESVGLSMEQFTADSTTTKTPASASRQKSLTDDLDLLEEQLDDLLGDSIDYRDRARHTTQTDEDLLLEMEELLA